MKLTMPSTKGLIAYLTSVALIISLSGCAFTANNWAFTEEVIDAEALSQIKRVGLLDVPVPDKIWLGTPEGASAGLFNPLISLATSTHNEGNPVNGKFISETSQIELQNWLQQEGIEVVLLKARRGSQVKMLRDYSQFKQTDVDAILEVAPITVGFRERDYSASDELSPEVMLTYRLIAPKTDQVLIESNVFYSSFEYISRGAGATLLGPPSHKFNDIESVRSQPGKAVERMEYAIKGATESIAQKVTNQSRTLRYSGFNPVKLNQAKGAEDVAKTVTGSATVSTTNTTAQSTQGYWHNLYSGNTASGETKKGSIWHVYYKADGTMFGRSTSKYNTESQDTGTWEISEDGIFCGRWKKWWGGSKDCFKETRYGDDKFRSTGINNSKEYIFVLRQGDPEKLGREPFSSTAGNSQGPATSVNQPNSDIDITGTYNLQTSVGSINGNARYPWIFNNKRKFKIELEHKNNIVRGRFLLGVTGSITGSIAGDRVVLTWFTANCSDGEGELTVKLEGSSLEGFWSCKGYSTNGEWQAKKQ